MVAIVDELEHRSLTERRRNPDDRRANALRLTSNGRKVLTKARRLAHDNDEPFCAPLPPTEPEQLLALFRRLAAEQRTPLGVHPGPLMPD